MQFRRRAAWQRRTALLAAVCLGLVVLADFLFYDAPIGWTAGLYAVALVVAVALRDGATLARPAGLAVTAAIAGLTVALVIEPTPLAVVLTLLGLVSLASLGRSGWTTSITEWLGRWAQFVWRVPVQSVLDGRAVQRWQRRHHVDMPGSGAVRRWWLPVVAGAVFVALFAIANPIVSDWLSVGWSWVSRSLERLPEIAAPLRVLMWLAVGAATWGLLRVRTRVRRRAGAAAGGPGQPLPPRRLDRADLAVRCLAVFNVIFMVQNLLDVRYLWGGAALPTGMTYAQYAHRGAYPLVATALLAGAFVLLAFRHRGAAQRSAWARRLVYLWLAQNVFLLVSAIYRLDLYVAVYSLTRWRVASFIWMALVAAGLTSIVWRIVQQRDNRWLLQVNVVLAAMVLYACCFVNIDGLIARYNVAHSREVAGVGVPLDVPYLEHLGVEALPALRAFATDTAAEHPEPASRAARAARSLTRELDAQTSDWRGWTLRRASLAGAAPVGLQLAPAPR